MNRKNRNRRVQLRRLQKAYNSLQEKYYQLFYVSVGELKTLKKMQFYQFCLLIFITLLLLGGLL